MQQLYPLNIDDSSLLKKYYSAIPDLHQPLPHIHI